MATPNSINCVSSKDFYVNFNGNSPSVGQYWSSSFPFSRDPSINCVEITDNLDIPDSNYLLEQQYVSCYECVKENYGVVTFENCFDGRFNEIYVNVSAFTEFEYLEMVSSLTGETTYYIEYDNFGSLQTGCYYPKSISPLSYEQYIRLSDQLSILGKEIINNLEYTGQTDCKSCLNVSSFVYEVTRCTKEAEQFDYVYLPSNTFPPGILISYTDGVNEFCGIVQQLITPPVSPTYEFITNYGEEKCETCLQKQNKKVLVQNCLDNSIQYVVWASQLFELGNSTNFELFGGCFEIVGETTADVDAIYLDYEPHSNCNSCLECNGIGYDYSLCSDPFNYRGSISTNQIYPTGTVFYNPNENDYCAILNTSSTVDFPLYPNLLEGSCFQPVTQQIFNAFECESGTQFCVITSEDAQIGDTVQILYGDKDYVCVVLSEIVDPIFKIIYNTKRDNNGDTIIYNQCFECTNGKTISLRTINCGTQELEIIDLSYSDYIDYFLSESIFNTFVDSNGVCRTVVESCPQHTTGNLVSISNTYVNCSACLAFNPTPTPDGSRSANAESYICQEICTESGTTVVQVSPPHPIWTDGYGTAVTQLNAISIGANGLNS